MAFTPLFERGEIRQTEAAITRLTTDQRVDLIIRHITGDWTEMADCDAQNNVRNAREGGEIISLYWRNGTDWIVRTDAARSVTTLSHGNEA